MARSALALVSRRARVAPRSFASDASPSSFAAHAAALRASIARLGLIAPPNLEELLAVLRATGARPVPPTHRRGLHPQVLPLASDADAREDGGVLGFFLRPRDVLAASSTSPRVTTKPAPLPIVRSGPGGVDLVAFSAAQHVHRALVYEDFAATTAGVDADPNGASNDLRTDFERRHRPVEAAAGAFGASLYVRGELAASALPSRPDAFAHRAVGKFPEVMASMALRHERLGDRTSALVTAEWFANDPDFEGWALAHAFNARALLRAGRTDEARDAARVALAGNGWDTVGAARGGALEMARIAGMEVEGREGMGVPTPTGGREARGAIAAVVARWAPPSSARCWTRGGGEPEGRGGRDRRGGGRCDDRGGGGDGAGDEAAQSASTPSLWARRRTRAGAGGGVGRGPGGGGGGAGGRRGAPGGVRGLHRGCRRGVERDEGCRDEGGR